jgi:hypothetical protein
VLPWTTPRTVLVGLAGNLHRRFGESEQAGRADRIPAQPLEQASARRATEFSALGNNWTG